MDEVHTIGIKDEQVTPLAFESPVSRCQASSPSCSLARSIKRDGSLHELCDLHRRQAQRKEQQRKRLLRILIDALQSEDDERRSETTDRRRRRRRPRLVLLGNQQSLILGIVLSDQGDRHDINAARAML